MAGKAEENGTSAAMVARCSKQGCGKSKAELPDGKLYQDTKTLQWFCSDHYKEHLLAGKPSMARPSPTIPTPLIKEDVARVAPVDVEKAGDSLNAELKAITGSDRDDALDGLMQRVKMRRSKESFKVLEDKMQSMWSDKGSAMIKKELAGVPYLTFLCYFVIDLIEESIEAQHIVLTMLNLDLKNKEDKALMRHPMMSDLLESLPWTFYLENTNNVALVIDIVSLKLEKFKLEMTDETNGIDPEAFTTISTILGFLTEIKHRSNRIYDKLEIVSESPAEVNKMITGVTAFFPRLGAYESDKNESTTVVTFDKAWAALKDEEQREKIIEHFQMFEPEWLSFIDNATLLRSMYQQLMKMNLVTLSPTDMLAIVDKWDEEQRRKFFRMLKTTLSRGEKQLFETEGNE